MRHFKDLQIVSQETKEYKTYCKLKELKVQLYKLVEKVELWYPQNNLNSLRQISQILGKLEKAILASNMDLELKPLKDFSVKVKTMIN